MKKGKVIFLAYSVQEYHTRRKMEIKKNIVNESKYGIKCPYEMDPKMIIVHNTANSASAKNEINYMISNDFQTSYHIAVDDVEAIQGIPFNRNSWNAGDGAEGYGNRNGISVEICYSLQDVDIDKFLKAERNAAKIIAQILNEKNWDISKVTKHQDYSGKYCPHRTLDLGWDRFIDIVKNGLNNASSEPEPPIGTGVRMVLTSSAARIRTDMPSGTIKTTIPNGSTFDVVGLYEWKSTDNYRWGWGSYNNVEGYFQYDQTVMHPSGAPTDSRWKMVLTGSAARIRSAVQGSTITTVANGSQIRILEFLGQIASDGYYWCRGTYGGVTGYFQYDPNVMYPTND